MAYGKEIINGIMEYVTSLFQQFQTDKLVYHNLWHTQNVVAKKDEIAGHFILSESELFVLHAAAWFHDCGHLFGTLENHELRSASIMREYLQKFNIDEKAIKSIEECILSTKPPCDPNCLLSEILCDADSYHLGTSEFAITDELVKKEYQLRSNHVPSNWNEATLFFLRSHRYFTSYCIAKLQDGKEHNIASLLAKQ